MSDQITSEQGSQQSQSTSGMAIAGLVLGVVALIMSFIPIINNAAFIAAIVGVILAIVGRSQAKKGAKGGAGVATAGIVLNIIAVVITLLMQMACSAALDSMTSGSSGTVSGGSSASASAAASTASSESAPAQTDTANMAVGQTADLDNGLSVTVNSVTPGLANYDGSPVTAISVTYANNGTSNASFNVLDWKAEDANGAQRSMTYYTQGTEELSSGTLSKGGTVTGNIYFDEPIVKVYYYSSFLNSDSNIAWNVA